LKTQTSIVKAIAYFDMFRYPVTAEEICRFLDHSLEKVAIQIALEQLVANAQVFRLDEFYSLQNDRSLIARRRKGNSHAAELLAIAYRIGKRLYRFPFVKGVGISGSLSKNYADADADIDFFIITTTNHLWIARTLLHALKKLSFLTGKQDWYCMNYFIDEEALVIAEKNIFTATEVVTLQPVCGSALPAFYMANHWALDFFPNYQQTKSAVSLAFPDPWYKKWSETFFSNRFGRWLDNYLMRVTTKRWLAKEKHHKLNTKGEPIGLLAGKHFARPNPEHLQKKLLGMFDERLTNLHTKWGMEFDDADHFLRKEII
jgi:hypothetical protein